MILRSLPSALVISNVFFLIFNPLNSYLCHRQPKVQLLVSWISEVCELLGGFLMLSSVSCRLQCLSLLLPLEVTPLWALPSAWAGWRPKSARQSLFWFSQHWERNVKLALLLAGSARNQGIYSSEQSPRVSERVVWRTPMSSVTPVLLGKGPTINLTLLCVCLKVCSAFLFLHILEVCSWVAVGLFWVSLLCAVLGDTPCTWAGLWHRKTCVQQALLGCRICWVLELLPDFGLSLIASYPVRCGLVPALVDLLPLSSGVTPPMPSTEY